MSRLIRVGHVARLGGYFTERWERLHMGADPGEPIHTFCVVTPTAWVDAPLLEGMVQVSIGRADGVVHEMVEIHSPVPLHDVRLPGWFADARPLEEFSSLERPFLSLDRSYADEGEPGDTRIGAMLAELVEVLLPLSEASRVPAGWSHAGDELLHRVLPHDLAGDGGGDGGSGGGGDEDALRPVRLDGPRVEGLGGALEAHHDAAVWLVEGGVNPRAVRVVRVSVDGRDVFRLDGWMPRAPYLDVEYEASVGSSSDTMDSARFDEPGLAEVPEHHRWNTWVPGAHSAESAVAGFLAGARSLLLGVGEVPDVLDVPDVPGAG